MRSADYIRYNGIAPIAVNDSRAIDPNPLTGFFYTRLRTRSG